MVEETNTETQETLQVTGGDLALIVKIIDAGSERGAWKGEELGTIGAIRTKLVTIVQAIAPVTDESAEADGEADGDEAGDAEVESTEEAAIIEEEPAKKPKKRKRGSAAA